jgi:LPXTG-motif cell wall-anchored protein
MKTVLDASDPTVDVKVTNGTGKAVTLQGWLNNEPAKTTVPLGSSVVELTFPEMTEGQAKLTLLLTAEGVEDVKEHQVLVSRGSVPNPDMATNAAKPAPPGASTSAAPKPSWSKSPKPKPSWTKSPKPSSSWTQTPTPAASVSELPKTGDSVGSFVLLGGGSLLLGMVVLGLAWAMGRRNRSASAV